MLKAHLFVLEKAFYTYKNVTFTLYGSFAKTYRGHGTDRALLGGILGFATYDERIRDAFELAEEMGVAYKFEIDGETVTNHPNTADIDLVAEAMLRVGRSLPFELRETAMGGCAGTPTGCELGCGICG